MENSSETLDVKNAAPMAPDSGDFSGLQLRRFASTGLGLALNAPRGWQDTSDDTCFQVCDPDTGAEFTASGFANPGMSLQQWADQRLSAVGGAMSFLHEVASPAELIGAGWKAISAQYRGCFPGEEGEKHYLVVCLRTDDKLISLTLTVDAQTFLEKQAFYRWLLGSQFTVYQVIPVPLDDEGVRHLRSAAESGDVQAQFSLGVLFEHGELVEQDLGQALLWYRKAADSGDATAQCNVGVFYANGYGEPQDYRQAVSWWRKAAAQNMADAQFHLCVAHANGLGVPRDVKAAIGWCRLAADQGHEEAQAQLLLLPAGDNSLNAR